MEGMVEMTSISVIMLTFNRERLVSRMIESILQQTFENFEYIIIDNGSTDDSGAICEKYAKRDKRIHVVHCERGNIGSGRNVGLDLAQGKHIAFVDDDDWAQPDFLEFLWTLQDEYQADIAICGAADKVFHEKKIMTAEQAIIELLWRKKYNMAFPTKLFRHELIENLRFPERGEFDDIALMYKVLAQANRVVYHGLPKYTFYRHNGNNSAWTTNHKLLNAGILTEYLNEYRQRTEWLSRKFPNSASIFRYFEWSFMLSMVEKIEKYQLDECRKKEIDMILELSKHRKEFLESQWPLDFEREWMMKYIQVGEL